MLVGAYVFAFIVIAIFQSAHAFAMNFTGIFALAGSITVAFAIAGGTSGTISGIVLSNFASVSIQFFIAIIAFTFAFAGAFAGAFAAIAALAGFFSVAVTASGIGLWNRAESKNDAWRFGAMLSYPFFCGAPLIAIYTTSALLILLTWQAVVVFWCLLFALCTLLWQRGQYLDRRARNPLQDIIPNPNAPKPSKRS